MHVSSDTFLLLQEPANEGAVEALIDENSRSPNLKIRVDPGIEKTVQDHTTDYPAHGRRYVPWFRRFISMSTAE